MPRPSGEAHPGLREIDCRGRLVMPGLINTHCHAAMSLQRSLADDIPLMKWLNEHIWPFEARQTPEDVALGMELGIVEMLLGGITSFVDMYYHQNRCVSVAERLGIRAVLGCNYFDSNIDEVFTELEEAADRAASCDRVRIAVAPHSPYTVSTKNLTRGLREAERLDLLLMTHIAGDAGRNTHHPRAVRCDARRIPRPAGSARAEDHRRTLRARYSGGYRHDSRAGHDRFAQPAEQHEDIEWGSTRKGRCSGPESALRWPPTDAARTTTWICGRSCARQPLLQKSATGDPTALPAREALRMATANGARAMGYADGELGVLRPGAPGRRDRH